MLSNVISHFVPTGESLIGRKSPSGDIPAICLSGLSIQQKHAIITLNKGDVEIKPGSQGAKTKVNGMALTGPLVLGHLDRVVFGMTCAFLHLYVVLKIVDVSDEPYIFILGSNHYYVFYNPLSKDKSKHSPDDIDYEFANKELAEAKGFGTQAGMSKGMPVF